MMNKSIYVQMFLKSFYFYKLKKKDGLVSINFAARVLLGDTKSDITEQGRYKSKGFFQINFFIRFKVELSF